MNTDCVRYVRWSEKDKAYVGYCPDLFHGGVCHGDDEKKVYDELSRLVNEEIAERSKPIFTCDEPESAQVFLRRLRARQRNQILIIILVSLCAMSLAAEIHGQSEVPKLLFWPGLIAVLLRLMVGGSRRPGTHLFRNDSARIYAGGIWYIFQEVDVKKIQRMVFHAVSFPEAEFFLILLVFKHRSGGRSGGVFPLYFCVQGSDLKHVQKWCQERNIDVGDGDRVTSPGQLPLFIR